MSGKIKFLRAKLKLIDLIKLVNINYLENINSFLIES
jgi:hypothetical protein